MPPESLNEIPAPRRDRSLVVAYWILGILALLEIIVAAAGLAPRIASNFRKSTPLNDTTFSQPAISPASEQSITTTPQTKTAESSAGKGTPEGQLDQPLSMMQPDTTERPFRQNTSNSTSPEGALMEILNADIKGTAGGTKTLQLAIKSRSQEPIEVPQVKVQVYFYDEHNGEIVPSKAQVTSRWLSAPVDWKNGKPELLEVRYLSDTADPDVRFAGYVVAIYYKGDLQDCRADPPKLKKLFEPKYFIGLDEP